MLLKSLHHCYREDLSGAVVVEIGRRPTDKDPQSVEAVCHQRMLCLDMLMHACFFGSRGVRHGLYTCITFKFDGRCHQEGGAEACRRSIPEVVE